MQHMNGNPQQQKQNAMYQQYMQYVSCVSQLDSTRNTTAKFFENNLIYLNQYKVTNS